MTAKDLIKILKRFPKDATIAISSADEQIDVRAQVNQDGEWLIIIEPKTESVN